jgi:PKD repeat protein
MIKRILIPSLILCSFLIASVSTVVAADKILNDSEDDVLDFLTGENVSSSPNIDVSSIDITEITYSRQNKEITLTLEVKGEEIENRGAISDLDAEGNVDVVAYILSLYTSNDYYIIYYVNNECQITYDSTSETEDISDFSVDGSVLTVSFDILSSDETYDAIYAEASYYKISGEDFAYLIDDLTDDIAPDVVTLEVTADGPSEGKIGESIAFSGEATGGESPYTWSWYFDDGETADTQNANHIFDAAGTYEVILGVADAYDNYNSSSLTITISDAEPSNGGDNDGEQESSNSGLILFVVIIAIIAIAGIAIVIYIIRR